MKPLLFVRMLSMLLVLVLTVQMLPVQILAADNDAASSSAPAAAAEQSKDVRVIEEITEKRTEFSKHFRLSNGLQMAVLYAEPVTF